jgi:hypothetical protein
VKKGRGVFFLRRQRARPVSSPAEGDDVHKRGCVVCVCVCVCVCVVSGVVKSALGRAGLLSFFFLPWSLRFFACIASHLISSLSIRIALYMVAGAAIFTHRDIALALPAESFQQDAGDDEHEDKGERDGKGNEHDEAESEAV